MMHGPINLRLRWMFRKLKFMCDKTKKNKMKFVCSTHMEDNIFIPNFIRKPEGSRPLGTLTRTWGIIIK